MRKLVWCILILGSCFLVSACATSKKTREMIRPISMETPKDNKMAAYLGLSPSQKNFKLTDIKAQVLVAEIFHVRCSHCQRQVEDLVDLYQQIEKEGLSQKVKIVAMGYSNELYEVEEYGRRFSIPYPLFADPEENKVKVEEIPITFVLKLTPEGARVIYEFHGILPGTDDMLKLIRQAGGL